MTADTVKLGRHQRAALTLLARVEDGRWPWPLRPNSRLLLDSLVRRGLVIHDPVSDQYRLVTS